MIQRKIILPPDLSAKSEAFLNQAEAAAKQAEIRKLRRKPIRNDEALKRLCMYLLLDTDNIAVVELDKRGKVLHITSVPLCFNHALKDYRYLYTILGERDFYYRAIAVHLRNTDEETVENTVEILERFRDIIGRKKTLYLMCRGFDIYSI